MESEVELVVTLERSRESYKGEYAKDCKGKRPSKRQRRCFGLWTSWTKEGDLLVEFVGSASLWLFTAKLVDACFVSRVSCCRSCPISKTIGSYVVSFCNSVICG